MRWTGYPRTGIIGWLYRTGANGTLLSRCHWLGIKALMTMALDAKIMGKQVKLDIIVSRAKLIFHPRGIFDHSSDLISFGFASSSSTMEDHGVEPIDRSL